MQPTNEKRDITKAATSRLVEAEWNFSREKSGKERVPDDELVACCYWEYARESEFIRRVVKQWKCGRSENPIEFPSVRSEDDDRRILKQAQGELEALNRDLTQLYSLGTTVELFRRLPFPKPWQSLTPAERNTGKDFAPKIPKPVKFPPFQVCSDYLIVADLYGQARSILDKRNADYQRLNELEAQGDAGFEEAAALRRKMDKERRHSGSLLVRGEGGVDSFIVRINWRDFTDNEIVAAFEQWVKATGTRPVPVTQLPKGVRGLKGGRGKDPQEWRAMLERLGTLRLRHCYSFDDAQPFLLKLGRKQKQVEPAECHRDAKKAVDDFHELFPFLNSADMPLSWPMLD